VGARIRELRKANGFTFDAFVGETELGRGYVSELERGLVMPTLSMLELVAKVLEVEVIDLLAVGGTPRDELVILSRDLSATQVRALARRARELTTELLAAEARPGDKGAT
jgi:transcriptional regulator with XRE-family HTH domain